VKLALLLLRAIMIVFAALSYAVSRSVYQAPHDLFEHLPPVLIVLELIETGARRSEQHHIAWLRHGVSLANGILQRFRVNHFGALNL
jgi:hypothetical protein